MTGKLLVVAEKPSVAADIARALADGSGKFRRDKDFFENDRYVVSSAVGHLLESAAPEGVEVKRGKWSLANLPVIPEHFDLRPIDKKAEERLKVLGRLYRRDDIIGVVNACDAGREGELIFHNIHRHFAAKRGAKHHPVQRLWLQSMTPAAIRAGFEALRPDEEMQPLKHAAVCRDESDWLIGINTTRAITALHSQGGGFTLTPAGRVQTPTLAILEQRDKQIAAFKPEDYREVHAEFQVAAGQYEGRWTNPEGGKRPERIFDAALAEKIVAEVQGGSGEIDEKKTPKSEGPPLLFDLTSLQRAANARFGFSARGTLAVAQRLYEFHKLITYPRTDSKFLPEDYPAAVTKTLSNLAGSHMRSATQEGALSEAAAAKQILDNQWIKPGNRRVFNNAKVSDHFAIIPTGEIKTELKDQELKIYALITRRFLSAFFPSARFEETVRRTTVAGHTFETRGRILVDPGWRAAAQSMPEDAVVTPVKAGETAAVIEVQSVDKQTTPPARYTEATLLSAMEGAGKLVEDEELREAMRERGLGTPATRAAIIEKLIRDGYVIRDQRNLLTTPKAHSLLRLLRALKISELTLPEMTGEWESKLRKIERAEFDHENFMQEIRKMTKEIVSAASACGDVENVDGDYVTLKSPCPVCGGAVRESHRKFNCTAENCKFSIWKDIAGREFSIEEAEALVGGELIGPLEGFRSKMGRAFSAALKLEQNDEGYYRPTFQFDNGGDNAAGGGEEDLSEREVVGDCPKCGSPVRAATSRYMCEKAVGEKGKTACDFSFGRFILRRTITPDDIRALLTEGKTGVLEGFVSKKTGRPFKAHLTLTLGGGKDAGKLGFEFPPRKGPPRKGARK